MGNKRHTYPKLQDDLRLRVGGKNLLPKAIEAVSEVLESALRG